MKRNTTIAIILIALFIAAALLMYCVWHIYARARNIGNGNGNGDGAPADGGDV